MDHSSVIERYLAGRHWGSPENWKRAKCECGATHRFYCPSCRCLIAAPVGIEVDSQPLLLQVEVILRDDHTKSTGIHAAVLSPSSTNVRDFKQSLHDCDYDAESTILLYPSPTSITLNEMTSTELLALKRVVVVDSKWTKAAGVLEHQKLSHLRHVKLAQPPTHSRFWRYHNHGEGKVSTIEALTHTVSTSDLPEIKLLMLFGLIRDAIEQSRDGKRREVEDVERVKGVSCELLPMDERAKEARRSQRRQKGTERQQIQKQQSQRSRKQQKTK